MAELGEGVRAWVGWCPEHQVQPGTPNTVEKCTILRGPYKQGEPYMLNGQSSLGALFVTEPPTWIVKVDNETGETAVTESILFPIDDGETEDTEEELTEEA